jgi:Fur family ferric uptake transcriptional regulator
MSAPLVDRLRDRGYRLTAQRRVVAEVLAGDNTHLSADEVHTRAAAVLPEISRATVYSTLQQFSALGEVRELALGGSAKLYDPNIAPRHHHLVCDRCDVVFDVARGVDAPALAPQEHHGMVLDDAEIVYHGVCATCASSAARSATKE